jgi:hypothetical protein
MEKYLLTIEFRYSDAPTYKDEYTSRNKEVTIGVFDDFDSACVEGNKLMETLESRFPLHVFPNGRGTAPKERFSKNGGPFGSKKNLISDMGYLKTPFSFYAKITTLKYGDIDSILDEVVDATRRYRKYKANEL